MNLKSCLALAGFNKYKIEATDLLPSMGSFPKKLIDPLPGYLIHATLKGWHDKVSTLRQAQGKMSNRFANQIVNP